ncbi:hypothetical protein LSAT2_014663, partial [Lamellibrachia satsuma]
GGDIRRRYKEALTNREKNAYVSLCASKLLTRYYAIGTMNEVLRVSSKRLRASTSPPTTRGHKHAIRRILRRKHVMREFFMLDKNLHPCFRNIQPMCTVSYPSFCRMRLFWVVSPNQSDRDTCLCFTHENMALLLAKLYELKVIPTKRLTPVLETVACDISNQSCMTASATWEIWKSVKEDSEIDGAKTQVTITKKIKHNGTIDERVEAPNTLMPRFKRHHFNMKHQQVYHTNLRSNLQYIECQQRRELSWQVRDRLASKLMPSDVESVCLAVEASSPLVIKNFADEIPARLVTELVRKEDYYLNGSFLRQGCELDDKAAERLPTSYAMHSDQYDPSANVKLTPLTIGDIYHQENIDITRRGEFMGTWQVHAVSSIFGAELVSIYPQRGNPEIRKHLHRSVMPREKLC